jgi:threonine synthase
MTWRSYLTHLECSRTGETYPADAPANVSAHNAPLLARYDLERLRSEVAREEITRRGWTMWRYRELLPVRDERNVVSFGESVTPVVPAPTLGAHIGVPGRLIKYESALPTGTFKARGAAVGVSRARELGIERVSMPTNGNAGAAWATYAARAGIDALIAMPVDAPAVTRVECSLAGARLVLVDGLIGDAGALVSRAGARGGYFDTSTLKEPYRLEGKKTMGLELVEQLGWRTPDVIVYPTGGGVGLIGIDKALQELRALGWLDPDAQPRLVSVQAEGCAPIVRAFEDGAAESQPWPDGRTVAFGINVGKAFGDFLVLDAVRRSNGTVLAVADADILAMQARCYAEEGMFVCPEGAAALQAVAELRASGWLGERERVLVLNTGSGVKYADGIEIDVPVLARDDEIELPANR